ncbi:MAG: hypothetical protein EA366_04055 [Spirulina sp. DLM2.Bin59]|nr:MAG: hypothetical protein EA366_04055 [Spirulina sp. DLM2.Bin59]
MVNHTTPGNELPLEDQIAYILETGQVSRSDYFQLMTRFLAMTKATPAQRQLLNQVFDQVQTGQITFGGNRE